jgi:hypothetical protein
LSSIFSSTRSSGSSGGNPVTNTRAFARAPSTTLKITVSSLPRRSTRVVTLASKNPMRMYSPRIRRVSSDSWYASTGRPSRRARSSARPGIRSSVSIDLLPSIRIDASRSSPGLVARTFAAPQPATKSANSKTRTTHADANRPASVWRTGSGVVARAPQRLDRVPIGLGRRRLEVPGAHHGRALGDVLEAECVTSSCDGDRVRERSTSWLLM